MRHLVMVPGLILDGGEPGADVAELPGAVEAAVPHGVAAGPLRWIPPPTQQLEGGALGRMAEGSGRHFQ